MLYRVIEKHNFVVHFTFYLFVYKLIAMFTNSILIKLHLEYII